MLLLRVVVGTLDGVCDYILGTDAVELFVGGSE
jgi:hypothetical protein